MMRIFVLRLAKIVLFFVFINVIISVHMRLRLPLTIVDTLDLSTIGDMFSLTGQFVFNRHQHLLSLLNPFLVLIYVSEDWNTLLNIPPLISQCPIVSTKLLLGLRFATIIPNTTYPRLVPRTFFKQHLRSKFATARTLTYHLMIILLTSSRTTSRFDGARRSWIVDLTTVQSTNAGQQCLTTSTQCLEYFECCLNISNGKSAKLIIVSDEADSGRGVVTLPELHGKNSYLDAQHRQLRMIQHIKDVQSHLLENIRWIALIDDDTWLNVHQTLAVLSMLDWHKPMAVGHILTEQESDRDLLYVAGGSGIFLSSSAFSIIASNLYNVCPFCKYNDITVGVCLAMFGIERVHIPSFLAFRPIELTPDVLENVASIHYMSPEDMINATGTLKVYSRQT